MTQPAADESWVDALLRPGSGLDPLLDAVGQVVFRDGRERMQLGALDQSMAAVLFWLLRRPIRGNAIAALSIELPRGKHEVSILLGILTQLARIHAHASAPGSPTDFPGSVTVIGMDTAMQRRLAAVSVERVPLSEGLKVHRVRSDGRLVESGGSIVQFQRQARRLLYLNTRVGWPTLHGEYGGVTIIDRTSFRNPDLLRRALDWGENHRANRVVVVNDRGDSDTNEILADHASAVFHWIIDGPIRQHLVQVLGPRSSRSRLSTNTLMDTECSTLRVTAIEAPGVESRFRDAYNLLKDAYKVDASLPYGVVAARRVLNVLNQLTGTVESFNASAALDHRSRSIRSLYNTVEQSRTGSFPQEWHGYASTRWGSLRKLTLELIELLDADNPKFMALLATVDLVARRMPDHAIVVRVASEAAAAALLDDLLPFETVIPDSERMKVVPWAARVPWADKPTVEILPALPPSSRRPLLWSGEATERIVLSYGWEQFVLERIRRHDVNRIQQALCRTFTGMGLGNAPTWSLSQTLQFDTVSSGPLDHEPGPGLDLSVNLDALIADLDELGYPLGDDQEMSVEKTAESEIQVEAYPLILEPSGDSWWVHCDEAVETLIAGGYQRLHLQDLKPGDQVIVPRGTGREDLFTRLVEAKYKDVDVRDLMVMMNRWKRACLIVIAECNGDRDRIQERLREAGCSTVTEIERWADGRTIAPQRSEDIVAVARAAGDEWLSKNWRRIAATATELRGLHISIGQRISGAMHEVVHGDGPHLQALADVLGADAAEILDEFDVAELRRVGEPQTVGISVVGTITSAES